MALEYTVYPALNIVTLRRVLSLTHRLGTLGADHLLWKNHVQARVVPRHTDRVVGGITDLNPWRYYALLYSARRVRCVRELGTKIRRISTTHHTTTMERVDINNWASLPNGFTNIKASYLQKRDTWSEKTEDGYHYHLLTLDGQVYKYQYCYPGWGVLKITEVPTTGVARFGEGDRLLFIGYDGKIGTGYYNRFPIYTAEERPTEVKVSFVDGTMCGVNKIALVTTDGRILRVESGIGIELTADVPILKVFSINFTYLFALGVDGSFWKYVCEYVGDDDDALFTYTLTRYDLPRVVTVSVVGAGRTPGRVLVVTVSGLYSLEVERDANSTRYYETPTLLEWPTMAPPSGAVLGENETALIGSEGIVTFNGPREVVHYDGVRRPNPSYRELHIPG